MTGHILTNEDNGGMKLTWKEEETQVVRIKRRFKFHLISNFVISDSQNTNLLYNQIDLFVPNPVKYLKLLIK